MLTYPTLPHPTLDQGKSLPYPTPPWTNQGVPLSPPHPGPTKEFPPPHPTPPWTSEVQRACLS